MAQTHLEEDHPQLWPYSMAHGEPDIHDLLHKESVESLHQVLIQDVLLVVGLMSPTSAGLKQPGTVATGCPDMT